MGQVIVIDWREIDHRYNVGEDRLCRGRRFNGFRFNVRLRYDRAWNWLDDYGSACWPWRLFQPRRLLDYYLLGRRSRCAGFCVDKINGVCSYARYGEVDDDIQDGGPFAPAALRALNDVD